jgi:hypothetical protein
MTKIDAEIVQRANDALKAGNVHAALEYLRQALEGYSKPTKEDIVSNARCIMRQEYHDSVESAAQGIKDEYCQGGYNGDRDQLIEAIDSCADSHVTYTSRAQECLLYSNNDCAGIDELGADGFDWKSGIPWSQLAYFAFRQDLCEELDSMGIDINGDPPAEGTVGFKCGTCDKIKEGILGNDNTDCNDCNEELGNEQCDICSMWYDPDSLEEGICETCASQPKK